MPHSFSQTASLTCPQCGRDFSAEIWLIVDADEHPDLLERIRAGTLHTITCPHCGHEGQVDAPLLLLRLGATPPLLFSPAQRTTEEQDREQAAGLVNMLREQMGADWQDEWLAQGLPGVPRPFLPAALSADPEAAEAALLVPTLQAFIQAETWGESRRILEAHPELLSDEADALLGELITAAQAQGDEDARRVFEEHRALLRRCREVGIEQAFAEKMLPPEALAQAEALGLTPEQAVEMARLASQMPLELREVLAELAAGGVEIRSPEDLERLLAGRPDPREKLEQVAAHLGGGPSIPPEFQDDLRRAQEGQTRYKQVGDLAALNEAVAAWERIVNHPAFPQADERFRLAAWNDAGGAYLRRYWATGALPDLEAAVAHWERAVRLTPEGSPNLPSILNNLANGLRARYARTGALPDLEAAVAHWERAVRRGLEVAPEKALGAARNWGRSAFERRAWEEAVRAYGYGRQAIDRLLAVQFSRQEKESWLKEAQEVPAGLAYAHAQRQEPVQAAEALEEGRTRLLREALERNRRDLHALPGTPYEPYYTAYIQAAQRVEDLHAIPYNQRPADWGTQIAQAQAALQTAIEALRQNVPGFAYFLKSLPFPEIQRQAADAPLVYLLATPAGGLALVVSAAGVQAVDLPELTEEALNGWLVKTDAAGQNVVGGYLPAQLAVPDWMPGALEELLPALGRALQPLVATLTPSPDLPSSAVGRGEGVAAQPPGEGRGVRAITLIPAGRLALLPLHAARLPDGSHLLDHFTISYAPSAQALQAARRQAAARQGAPLFLAGVGNPLPPPEALADLHRDLQAAVTALPDQERIRPLREELATLVTLPTAELLHEGFLLRRLIQRLPEDLGEPVQRLLDLSRRWPQSLRYAKAELQSVVDLLPPQSADPLYEQEATLPAVLERFPRATAVHLSCHGIFQADDPLQSGLLLVDEEGREARLTLRDLFAEKSTALGAARLVVLSACQTAVTDFGDLPEEAIGLPAGFLQAGVPAVIGTLWSVDDAATALLVTRMYEYMLQEHLSPPLAVRQAQRWLRDLTNADLEAYLTHHEAIAKARLESGRRMPLTLLEELMVKVITTEKPQARPYADPRFWAPFTFTGVGEVRL